MELRRNNYKTIQGILKKTLSVMLIFTVLAIVVVQAISTDVYADDEAAGPAPEVISAETKPEAPQIKVAVKGDGLAVKWKRVSGAKTYAVYRSYRKATGWKLIKKGVTGRSYTDRTVESGKRAYYKVRAFRADGSHSKLSDAVRGIIYRVYVETGHGTDIKNIWDSGCTWNGYQEAKLMIPICKAAAKYLRAKGIYVYTDAFDGNNRNLKYTIRQIKAHDVSVLLNVHCDYRYAPSGTMPLYRYEDQKELARCLKRGVHRYVSIRNRGLVKRTDLDTLNNTRGYCVACLFETGSISKDNTLLRTKYNAYGKGLARGICDYLGVEW